MIESRSLEARAAFVSDLHNPLATQLEDVRPVTILCILILVANLVSTAALDHSTLESGSSSAMDGFHAAVRNLCGHLLRSLVFLRASALRSASLGFGTPREPLERALWSRASSHGLSRVCCSLH